MALSIIVDDTRTDSFTFGPPDWSVNTVNPWFNGTGHVSPQSGQLSMTFNGESFYQIPLSSEFESWYQERP